jgi:type II secretory pathway pseudopilin PulG
LRCPKELTGKRLKCSRCKHVITSTLAPPRSSSFNNKIEVGNNQRDFQKSSPLSGSTDLGEKVEITTQTRTRKPNLNSIVWLLSLIAFLLAILIAVVLAPTVLDSYRRANLETEAYKSVAQSFVELLDQMAGSFRFDMGRFPKDLRELVQRPQGADADQWDGPYLPSMDDLPTDSDGLPLDPWKRSFFIKSTDGFSVASAGPDGRQGTRDDIQSKPRRERPDTPEDNAETKSARRRFRQ